MITENGAAFGQPDFNAVGEPFNASMIANHPDDEDKAGFGGGSLIGEAEAYGTLWAQYAAEWAAHLEGNGCTYEDGAC